MLAAVCLQLNDSGFKRGAVGFRGRAAAPSFLRGTLSASRTASRNRAHLARSRYTSALIQGKTRKGAERRLSPVQSAEAQPAARNLLRTCSVLSNLWRAGLRRPRKRRGSVRGAEESDRFAPAASVPDEVRAGAALPGGCRAEPETAGAVPRPYDTTTVGGNRVG